jgi:hypothetical protein
MYTEVDEGNEVGIKRSSIESKKVPRRMTVSEAESQLESRLIA